MIKKLFTFCLISFCCINANAGYICREIESNVNCYPIEESTDWECTVPKSSNIQVKGIAQCKNKCEDNPLVCQSVNNSSDNSLCHCQIVWPVVPGYPKYVQTYSSEMDCKLECAAKCALLKGEVLNYLYDERARPNFEEQ